MLRFFRIDRPTDADLALDLDGDVDRLLHAVDVRGERGDEDPALAQRDDLAERLADEPLGAVSRRAARRSSSRRAAGRRRGCRSRRAADVGLEPVHGRVVDLVVAGVQRPGRPATRARSRPCPGSSAPCARTRRGRARSRTALSRARASRSSVVRRSPCSSSFDWTSPSVSRVAHTSGTPTSRSRYGSAPTWSSWPCVRTHRAHTWRVVAQVAEVREDEVDPEVLVAGEGQPGVDDDDLVVGLEHGHVLADLARGRRAG